MDECIFCKIVNKQLPSFVIYESINTLAFLGIYPPVKGYTLVIPKTHSDELWQMPSDQYISFMQDVLVVAKHLKTKFNPKRLGMQLEGLEVPHTHIKLLPINTGADFYAKEPTTEPDFASLESVAEELKFDNL